MRLAKGVHSIFLINQHFRVLAADKCHFFFIDLYIDIIRDIFWENFSQALDLPHRVIGDVEGDAHLLTDVYNLKILDLHFFSELVINLDFLIDANSLQFQAGTIWELDDFIDLSHFAPIYSDF